MCEEKLAQALINVHTNAVRGINVEWTDPDGFIIRLCGTPTKDTDPAGLQVFLLEPEAEPLSNTIHEELIAKYYTDRESRKGPLYTRLKNGLGNWVRWGMVPLCTFYMPSH